MKMLPNMQVKQLITDNADDRFDAYVLAEHID